MKELVAGILGGMGPEATVDLMHRIIAHTDARDDIDHVRCIVDNNPKVPSRIKALLEGGGESPAPCMADMGRRLEAWGADFLCIACNTAHNYHAAVQAAVRIPVLNMIELTAQAVRERHPAARRIGLLASPAVRLTRLYEDPCARRGLEILYPAPVEEQLLLGVIKDIKAGHTDAKVQAAFAEVTNNLTAQGAEVLVVACTELGIICGGNDVPVVDAADVLAETVVETAKQRKPLPHVK
ncbi:amino acid racemase [uncultured Desulfovibrio sp.]|uniref:Amino acid racemase n=1 Tax=Candidatus Desulfovibrio intestinavium TaxID=2838534 RepID=A0A9D2HMP7_9BACT|nr:amino acid racemase [uncultured Desulfovibrio sp.]HJA78458.1 amino acid racemase [Candidatus Desulfovibrio intestinavium]